LDVEKWCRDAVGWDGRNETRGRVRSTSREVGVDQLAEKVNWTLELWKKAKLTARSKYPSCDLFNGMIRSPLRDDGFSAQ
jgi:hypothetical protein